MNAAIIVNYHSDREVGQLAGKLGQMLGLKIVVVDNGPWTMGDLGGVGVIRNRRNLGFAGGANVGIKEALRRGAKVVVLLNPDLVIEPEALERLLQSKADIVGPVLKFKKNGQWMSDFGGRVNWMFGRTTHVEESEFLQTSPDYVSGACMVVKRGVFEKIGLFDERFFLYLEDADFCLRAKRAGFTVAIDADTVAEHKLEIVKESKNWFKKKHNLISNFLFINKWVPWYFWPAAYGYWFALAVKVWFQR